MAKINRPRHGTMAVRPRKRASSMTARVVSWPKVPEPGLLGFAGYKAGMSHVMMIDDEPGSITKGHEISVPVTVVETPPLFVFGFRCYEKTPYGERVACDVLAENIDKKVQKRLRLWKKFDIQAALKKADEKSTSFSDVRVLVMTAPHRTPLRKKKPERMEIALGGKDVREKLEQAKKLLGKEVRVGDVFKDGEYVDAIAVTKGKGWQGAVKRFGVSLQRRKATGKRRHVGTLGPWHPAFVMYTVPMAGQTGFHKRTELNKRILKVGTEKENVTPNGGFMNYGVVSNDYLLVKGSLPGPTKRLIRFRKAMRTMLKPVKPEIRSLSLESKQGV